MMITIPNDLRLRIISSLVLLPPVLYALLSGNVAFQILIVLAAVIMSFEWNNIISHDQNIQLDLKQRTKWDIVGVFYILFPCTSLLIIRSFDMGLFLCLWLFISVWAVDISAYFSGKIFGGPKLFPAISPNKTWSGFLGGMLAAIIISVAFSLFVGKDEQQPSHANVNDVPVPIIASIGSITEIEQEINDRLSNIENTVPDLIINAEPSDLEGDLDNNNNVIASGPDSDSARAELSLFFFIFVGISLAVVSQAGDFFESWVKRRFGVKDSGATIPGHGGLLDRVDGLVTAAPFLLFIILAFGLS